MSTKAGAAVPSACICQPSKVLTCDNVTGLTFTDSDTIAFGKWKMKFNANISKAYIAGKWSPLAAIKKTMR